MNLLPPGARKMLRKEYWLRVTSVWAILAVLAIIAVSVLLVPSYLLIGTEEEALETERLTIAQKDNGTSSAEKAVMDANELAAALRAAVISERLTPIITAVNEAVPSGVTLTSYSMARVETVVEELIVVGIADTRDALIAFERSLEEQEAFTSVDVPIADLVKERDLPFRISIMLRTQTKKP